MAYSPHTAVPIAPASSKAPDHAHDWLEYMSFGVNSFAHMSGLVPRGTMKARCPRIREMHSPILR